MIRNKIVLGRDSIIVRGVIEQDLAEIYNWIENTDCRVQVLKDDGTYHTIEVFGDREQLYIFMLFAFCGLSGVFGQCFT